MIDLRNFVNININYFASSGVSGSRETAVLISSKSFDTDSYYGSTDTTFVNLKDFESQSGLSAGALHKFVSCFFDNGGKQLHFVEIDDTGLSESEKINAIVEVVSHLPNEEIVIATTFGRGITQSAAELILANDHFKGINEKVLITNLISFDMDAHSCVAIKPAYQPKVGESLTGRGFYVVKNSSESVGYLKDGTNEYELAEGDVPSSSTPVYFIMKSLGNDAWANSSAGQDAALPSPSTSNLIVKVGPLGSEMSLVAYLTKINVYRGRIEDYCYTKEIMSSVGNVEYPNSDSPKLLSESVISSDDVKVKIPLESGTGFKTINIIDAIKERNFNCDVELPQYGVVSFGGNMCDGKDLVNNFVKIVLTQTVTSRIMQVLTNKIRYNQSGISALSNVMVDELNRYRNYGYLTTDKIYTEESVYDESGKYLILEKNTLLAQGYTFTILPFGSLSDAEKKSHKLPKIYLILADSYSIREIEIEGSVY